MDSAWEEDSRFAARHSWDYFPGSNRMKGEIPPVLSRGILNDKHLITRKFLVVVVIIVNACYSISEALITGGQVGCPW